MTLTHVLLSCDLGLFGFRRLSRSQNGSKELFFVKKNKNKNLADDKLKHMSRHFPPLTSWMIPQRL